MEHDSPGPKRVLISTDGACLGNPGPGGYGVVLLYGRHRRELSGGFALTTNNRMEIMAAIAGLEALKGPCAVTLSSDSQYLVNAMTRGWARRWQANDWWRTKDERAVNADLWARLLALCERHAVEFAWVKGHNGDVENERCDALSREAINRPDLPDDPGYQPAQGRQPGSAAKITHEGQPCRKCATPVVRQRPRAKPKAGGAYYYEYYFLCPNCKTMYMVEEAKRRAPALMEPLL